ncbi:hypothetical protein X279_06185 [Oenococcus oeni IOEB_0501]|nr:hypothetical protein X279_06185 [Oenococcus oeni IOEB_0501]
MTMIVNLVMKIFLIQLSPDQANNMFLFYLILILESIICLLPAISKNPKGEKI